MKSPNYSDRGAPPRFVVIHWWGNPEHHRNADPSGVIRHLCTPAGTRSVSAHAVVYPGGTVELVDPEYAAWHAKRANRVSIGIECWPWDEKSPKQLVEATLENLAKQISHYYRLYPHLAKERLHPHSEHVTTDCPGDRYRAMLGQIHSRALEIYQGKPAIQETEKKGNPAVIIFRTPDGICRIFHNGEVKENPSQTLLSALMSAGVPLVNISYEDLEFLLPSADFKAVPFRTREIKDLLTDFPGMSESLRRTSVLAKIQSIMGIPARQS
ncbi:peptidoglycan recognition family protein [uncultured Mobiluncus sp.]|uniref:peptidoglycan recognition protein family protein n=1 Tax=uncultured Mobiluncus sp. TaxID=293425 RepID=UPI0026368667|nr:peptidoglycan recognition family protein [uncultured Mobiluncus sp.]